LNAWSKLFEPVPKLLTVTLAGAILFVADRFVFNVFGVGFPYGKSLLALVGMLIVPLFGFTFVLFRSSLLRGRPPVTRFWIAVLSAICLAIANFYIYVIVFVGIAGRSGVQFW
jgi:hypothetical protein